MRTWSQSARFWSSNSTGPPDGPSRARARDLLGRQTAQQAERERHARLGREHRMTGDEHEAQEVVADAVVERGVEIRRRQLSLRRDLATELLVLALDELASAQQVDRTVLRGG